MKGYYVYDDEGNQIAYVNAENILEAYKEAVTVTGKTEDDLSVERSEP